MNIGLNTQELFVTQGPQAGAALRQRGALALSSAAAPELGTSPVDRKKGRVGSCADPGPMAAGDWDAEPCGFRSSTYRGESREKRDGQASVPASPMCKHRGPQKVQAGPSTPYSLLDPQALISWV